MHRYFIKHLKFLSFVSPLESIKKKLGCAPIYLLTTLSTGLVTQFWILCVCWRKDTTKPIYALPLFDCFKYKDLGKQNINNGNAKRSISAHLNICPWHWHMTAKINRVHPLFNVNISAKFDEHAHSGLVYIMLTVMQARTDTLTELKQRSATRRTGIKRHEINANTNAVILLSSGTTDVLIMETNYARIGSTRRTYALKHTLHVIFRDTIATFLQNLGVEVYRSI